MKVFLPVEIKSLDAPVSPSLGRTLFFLSFDIKSGGYEYFNNNALISQGGAGVKAAQMIASSGARALITCRCGEDAAKVLTDAGVGIYKAQNGSAKENIEKFAGGQLAPFTKSSPGVPRNGGIG